MRKTYARIPFFIQEWVPFEYRSKAISGCIVSLSLQFVLYFFALEKVFTVS